MKINKNIVVTAVRGNSNRGKTYNVLDEKTGKEYIINQYPKSQRSKDSANYAVSEKYGSFLGKFRTKRNAMSWVNSLWKVV
jgi:hypothetical protein